MISATAKLTSKKYIGVLQDMQTLDKQLFRCCACVRVGVLALKNQRVLTIPQFQMFSFLKEDNTWFDTQYIFIDS